MRKQENEGIKSNIHRKGNLLPVHGFKLNKQIFEVLEVRPESKTRQESILREPALEYPQSPKGIKIYLSLYIYFSIIKVETDKDDIAQEQNTFIEFDVYAYNSPSRTFLYLRAIRVRQSFPFYFCLHLKRNLQIKILLNFTYSRITKRRIFLHRISNTSSATCS